MKYTKLSLVLTDRCNASCDFCSLSCGPDGRNVMDGKLMQQVIREAGTLGVKIIEFTGGEPFLYPKLLIEGARTAHEEKLAVLVTTNGFWGCWDNQEILNILKALKPDRVNISSDFFHQQTIPLEHVTNAIQACWHLKIDYRMLVADLEGTNSAGRYMESLGNQYLFSVKTCIYPVHRCGRAINLPEEWFLPAGRTENTLSVFYDGEVYACDPNEARGPAVNPGNVLRTPLRELISASAGSERYHVERKEQEGVIQ